MGRLGIVRSIAKVNGINIFYRDTASDKPPMLLLHGRWGRGETWIDFISRYKERFRLIAPDQRGHGLSDRPVARYAPEDFARDMFKLVKYLGCGPLVVVGHSRGGRNAAEFAYRYPEMTRALAILDQEGHGPSRVSEKNPEEIEAIDPLFKNWPTPFESYTEAVEFLSERFPLETNFRYFLESLYETDAGYVFMFSAYAMNAISVYDQNLFGILPAIKCPTLLVRAAESWCLKKEEAEKMRGLITDCTYFEVSHSDHMVYADNPDEFYTGFDSWLAKIGQINS